MKHYKYASRFYPYKTILPRIRCTIRQSVKFFNEPEHFEIVDNGFQTSVRGKGRLLYALHATVYTRLNNPDK